MANWAGTLLTEAGQALQAKAEAGATLNITKIKLGDGLEDMDTAITLTDLMSARYEANVVSKKAENNTCTITSLVSSGEIVTGFYAREMGIFALDPGVGEILYAVSIDQYPDYVPPKTASVLVTAEYALKISISNVDNISIQIDFNGLATMEAVYDAANIVKRATDYAIGAMVHDSSLPQGMYLKCIQAGTTGSIELKYLDKKRPGNLISDGTVQWKVVKLASIDNDVDKYIQWYVDTDGNMYPEEVSV